MSGLPGNEASQARNDRIPARRKADRKIFSGSVSRLRTFLIILDTRAGERVGAGAVGRTGKVVIVRSEVSVPIVSLVCEGVKPELGSRVQDNSANPAPLAVGLEISTS